jgi:hypothetical protein
MSRFFEALVVAGAGLTLSHCGGATTFDGSGALDGTDVDDDDTGGPDGQDQGVGGRGGASPGSTSGGRPSGSSGTGGYASGGYASETGSTTQWNCTTEYECPPDFGDLSSPAVGPCPVEPWRPRSSSDCEPGAVFRCLRALVDGRSTLVNCECSQAQDCSCPEVFVGGGCSEVRALECGPTDVVCGCAYTCILR